MPPNLGGFFGNHRQYQQSLLRRIEQLEKEVADHEAKWKLVVGKPDTGELGREGNLLFALETFFSEGELRSLCLHLGIDYDSLPGAGTFNKARELILYCKRRNQIKELFRIVRKERPFVDFGAAIMTTKIDPLQ